jgi:hypothetical protein
MKFNEREEIIERLQKVAKWYEDHMDKQAPWRDSRYPLYQDVMEKIYALKMGLPYSIEDVSEECIGYTGGKIATLQKNYCKMGHVVGNK